ncbi:hypothetical protein APHAL10511_007182 [Amanita phalloides]|nr:hypothetical protein APHAL10511_007182 [Amanita phalloides]
MSRSAGNNVRGPSSALTEFLREAGITPTTVARRRGQDQDPVAGPSQLSGNDGEQNDDSLADSDQAVEEASRMSLRRRDRAIGYASDNMDDSEGDGPESSAPAKKRRRTKTSDVKLKGKEKKKDDEDYEEEDTYTALSRILRSGKTSSSRPTIGSFENCANCGKQFTVTKYTVSANPGPGFLCHQCAKASGTDPFQKTVSLRKRKAPAEKRTIQSFEERRFPTLVSLCIQLITKHIDDVEALGDIGTVNMEAIAKALAKNRSLTPENAHLFYSVDNTTLVLYDCTKLTAPALQSLSMLNPALVSLRLDFCGHLDTETFNIMAKSLPHLKRIELLGPFLVRSEAWISFFNTHPHLEGFLVTQCPRFDLNCVKSLIKECPSLNELKLKEMRLSEDWLREIGALNVLKVLDLSSPATPCSEDALIQLLSAIGPKLGSLNLSSHESITDNFLEDGLGKWTGSLEKLSLVACPEITDRAVSRLFDAWIGEEAEAQGPDVQEAVLNLDDVVGPVRSWNRTRTRSVVRRRRTTRSNVKNVGVPPCLNTPLVAVELGRNHLLGSRSLISILRHSGSRLESLTMNGWKDVTAESLQELGKYAQELRKLDVGWCRNVDDFILAGWVGFDIPVEGSDRTTHGRCLKLTEIKVWGCNRVTGKFSRRRGVIIHGIESQTVTRA